MGLGIAVWGEGGVSGGVGACFGERRDSLATAEVKASARGNAAWCSTRRELGGELLIGSGVDAGDVLVVALFAGSSERILNGDAEKGSLENRLAGWLVCSFEHTKFVRRQDFALLPHLR